MDVKLDRSDLGLIADANDRPVDAVVVVVVVVVVAAWLLAEVDFGEDELGEEDPDDAADELIVWAPVCKGIGEITEPDVAEEDTNPEPPQDLLLLLPFSENSFRSAFGLGDRMGSIKSSCDKED